MIGRRERLRHTETEPGASRTEGWCDRPVEPHERDPRRYELFGELGRGGGGVVIEAFDRELDRVVALKELRRTTPSRVARFLREARITARLNHPGIVAVHDVGRWPDGTAFYAMAFVSGWSLEERIGACASLADRLALVPIVHSVAEVIRYAHGQGIIHRDIKPANVMIGRDGETVLVDWGLAKDLEAAHERDLTGSDDAWSCTTLTIEGHVMGSPAYMAPEQARGEHTDERTDIYLLGALLFHVVVGQPPYSAARDSSESIAHIRAREPDPLVHWSPQLPPDLAAIVQRAMAHSLAERYPTADAFAAALTSYVGASARSTRHQGRPRKA